MKKILSLLIAGLLLASMVACNNNENADEQNDGAETVAKDYIEDITGTYEYDLNEEGDYEIISYKPSSVAVVDLVLPFEANGRDIVGIAPGVFKASTTIKSVTIPTTYEYIGDAAFADCDLLTTVVIPQNITKIGKNIFDGCDNLTAVSLSAKITEIPEYAFNGCKALTAIDLSNVTTIQKGAFTGCAALKTATVSDKIEYADRTAFAGCTSLAYNTNSGLCYLGNTANPNVLLVKPESLNVSSCTVSATTKVIADNAFINCESLKSVTLSDAVKVINGTSFDTCTALKYNVYENGCYLGTAANPYMVLIKLEMPNVEDFTLNANTKIITATAFDDAKNLEDIGFAAPKATWDAIIKAENWTHGLTVNVSCSDLNEPFIEPTEETN